MIPALQFDKITVTFSGKSGAPGYCAVKDVSLSIAEGEFVSVVGPTGCGKSTLLNIGAGLLKASGGVVKVFGEPLAGLNARAGYMFQADSLMPWRSALDNVTAGLQFRGDGKARAAHAHAARAPDLFKFHGFLSLDGGKVAFKSSGRQPWPGRAGRGVRYSPRRQPGAPPHARGHHERRSRL